MQLIVAEKPSVARDLARVLGVRASGQHAFEGDDHVITWCVGHLVELDEPAAYDGRWKAWRLDTLPMLPDAFRLRPAHHAGPQLRAVVKLLGERRFQSVVNACDAGREGELIFRYVVQFAGRSPPVRRLWISSLTDDAIRRGFAALRPGGQLDALGDAARSRSEADWLVGMNATRAITARGRSAGHDALYSIGRVQTPTLAMLVHREQAIRAFVPRPYWELRGEFSPGAGGPRFTARWQRGPVVRLATAAIADAIVARDAALGAAGHPHGPRVEKLRARTVREPPPLLFDLTALQRTANRRFGFSAARTLEIAQALYERHKILTYPRTDARHLSSDVARELAPVFEALAGLGDYARFAAPLLERPPRPGRRVVDDAKVHDHHAIIPTAKPARLDALDRDERRLFDLVVRRFLAAFYPDAEFAVTEVWIRVGAAVAGEPAPTFAPERPPGATGAASHADRGSRASGASGGSNGSSASGAGAAQGPSRGPGAGQGTSRGSGTPAVTDDDPALLDVLPPPPDRYFARGRVRLAAGWQDVAGFDGNAPARERDAPEAEPVAVLPALVEGQPLDATFSHTAKHTTPPPRYSEATLLGAMESAGKTIDDEALRLAMKDTGLGTPATRAAVIETLLKRDYIARARQHLVPTPLGIALIETLPVASLASPELTGAWEARLARIARGQDSRAAFMADIARYVSEMIDAIRGSTPPAAPDASTATPVGRCPRCGNAVVQRTREFACSAGCGFTMRDRVAGRAIDAGLAGVLLEHRRSQVLRGFRSKAGKPFSAALVLDDTGELRFDFGDADHGPTRPRSGTDAAAGTDAEAEAEAQSSDSGPAMDREVSAEPRDWTKRAVRKTSAESRSRSRAAVRKASAEPRDWTKRAAPNVSAEPRDRSRTPNRDVPAGPRDWTKRAAPKVSTEPRDRSRPPNRDVPAEPRDWTKRAAPKVSAEPRDRSRIPNRDVSAEPRDRPRPSASPRAKPVKVKPAAAAKPAAIDQLTCPRCRLGTLLTGSRGWGCSRWREGCGFVVWFETAGKQLTPAQLRDLVTRGKTRKATFRPDGGEREGRLVLDPAAERGSARFEPT